MRSHRAGESAEASFKTGKLKGNKEGKLANEPDGTFIQFELTRRFLKVIEFRPELVEEAAAALQLPEHGPEADIQRPVFPLRRGLLDLVLEDLAA